MIRTASVALGLTVALLFAGSPRAGAADLLANGGFEQGTGGWSVNAGQLDAVQSPVHAGNFAGRFSGYGQPSTQFAYQVAAVRPDEAYEASGWMAGTGSGLTRAFLRVSWFDAGGQLVSQSDSLWLPQFDGSFYRLTTGVLLSPSAARTVRVSAVVQADSSFEVHLDDYAFAGPAASPTTPAPSLSPTPSVQPSPTPNSPPPSRTPRPSSRTPSPPSGATAAPPTPAEVIEPVVFPELVNGSFDELRADGSPYGWRKQGGEIGGVGEPRTDGTHALALNSRTISTKWAYQTISVTGGAHYRAAVDVSAGQGAESGFLRLSWYASADGSGPALSSVDSIDSPSPGDSAFRRLTTEVVQAPMEAASVKFRLMLRPISEEPAIAYFDAASFSHTQPTGQEIVVGPARVGRSDDLSISAPPEPPKAHRTSTDFHGTPVLLTNLRPERESRPSNGSRGGGNGEGWAIVLAIAVAVSAIAAAGSYELWQRRIARRDRTLRED